MKHEITREIGIDAGHRVTHHGSKCKNLHGHRYTIQATCRGPLVESGASEGMVLDFGFLKDAMMRCIDSHCDHALILWSEDSLLGRLLSGVDLASLHRTTKEFYDTHPEGVHQAIRCDSISGRIYIVPFVPTAEALAKHWFELLAPDVLARSQGNATLIRVRVWETPNSYADFACE